jgi:hypothetical protein
MSACVGWFERAGQRDAPGLVACLALVLFRIEFAGVELRLEAVCGTNVLGQWVAGDAGYQT